MDKKYIPARGISMLEKIKQTLMDDNDLCVRVSGCGNHSVAKCIDEVISSAITLESLCHYYMDIHALEKEENKLFRDLLGGYSPDMLSDKEKAQVSALVAEWEKADEEE